ISAGQERHDSRHDSNTTFQDSAYASGSGTGRSRSQWSSEDRSSFSSRTMNQLPRLRNSQVESPEMAKMRIVVKRLEEIFTGREGATSISGPGGVQQVGMMTTPNGDSSHVRKSAGGLSTISHSNAASKMDLDGLETVPDEDIDEEGAREDRKSVV